MPEARRILIFPEANITKNFKWKEFISPLTEPQQISWGIASNIVELACILEKLREKLQKPLIITSGWRDEGKNKQVGGAPNSAHLLAKAVDFKIGGVSGIQELFEATDAVWAFFTKWNCVGEFIIYCKKSQKGNWYPSRFHFATPFIVGNNEVKEGVFLLAEEGVKKYFPIYSSSWRTDFEKVFK